MLKVSGRLYIMQVDDNMVNRRVATSMLARYGATVAAVNGGMEAINAIRDQKVDEAFDLVLMDIQMPEVEPDSNIFNLDSPVSGTCCLWFAVIFFCMDWVI